MIRIDTEFRSVIPALSKEEYEGLEQSLIKEGCRDALLTWDGILVDGHNRYEICMKHRIDYKENMVHFEDRDEAICWIVGNQLNRRNLTKETQSYLRGLQYEMEKKRHGGDRKCEESKVQNAPLISTAKKLSIQHNVDQATIKRDAKYMKAVDTIVKNTSPEVKRQILNREINITKSDTERMSIYEPEKQKEIISKLASGEAKGFVDAKRLIKRQEVNETPEIKGKYRVLYADCPWQYGDTRDGKNYTGAEDHYPTMSIKELCELPVKDLTEDNAVLFFWVTSPLLEECFEVIRAWGFKYKTSFVWDKIKHNMGHYNSVRHELLLICTKGSCLPSNNKLYDSVVSIERSDKHSEKPEEFRNIIDTLYPDGGRIELFSRKQVAGWTSWGNQV